MKEEFQQDTDTSLQTSARAATQISNHRANRSQTTTTLAVLDVVGETLKLKTHASLVVIIRFGLSSR